MLTRLFKKIPAGFDITIYLRYLPIIKLINRIAEKNKLEIAEVGSGNFGIGPYLKKDFTGFDVAFLKSRSPFLKPINVSASKIPKKFFNQFDIVLSVDMLEHLSPEDRDLALKNMISLTRGYLLLAFPSGQPAHWVDKILNWYYRKTHQKKLNFLTEHLKFSLPKVREVETKLNKLAREQGKKIIKKEIVGNSSVFVYLGLLFLGFSQNKYLTRLFSLAFFGKKFLAKINFLPYRKLIVLELA